MKFPDSYLQNRNRLTDLENECTVGYQWGRVGGVGIDSEFGTDMYTLLYLK